MSTTTTPTSANCAVCRAQWSSVTCKACEQRVCRGCCESDGDGDYVCRTCAYSVMGADMEQRARTVEADAAGNRTQRARWLRRGMTALALVGSLATLVFVLLPEYRRVSEQERVFAYGAVGDGDDGLEACVGGLWDVRKALDRYIQDHEGSLPRSLEELVAAPHTCPGCGGRWAGTFAPDGTWRVGCPLPGQHDRVAVFLDQRVGPPQVQMLQPGGGSNP